MDSPAEQFGVPELTKTSHHVKRGDTLPAGSLLERTHAQHAAYERGVKNCVVEAQQRSTYTMLALTNQQPEPPSPIICINTNSHQDEELSEEQHASQVE